MGTISIRSIALALVGAFAVLAVAVALGSFGDGDQNRVETADPAPEVSMFSAAIGLTDLPGTGTSAATPTAIAVLSAPATSAQPTVLPEIAAAPTTAPDPTAAVTATETATASDSSSDENPSQGTAAEDGADQGATDGDGADTDAADLDAAGQGTAGQGDSTNDPTATPQPTPAPTSSAPTPTPIAEPTSVPVSTIELPPPSAGGTFNHVLFARSSIGQAQIFDEPGGQVVQVTYQYLSGDLVQNDLSNPTHFGNTLALQVLRGAPGDEWAQVSLPTRPSGQTGWVQTADYDWSSSNYLVRINVGNNSVSIWEGSNLVLETNAVTGTSSSPTPLLNGYVDEKVTGLSSAYGPILLSLGIFSNSLNTFGSNGEVPKIALHGTNAPELIGQYASNGCIRVENSVIRQIADTVPVGSRVEIVSG